MQISKIALIALAILFTTTPGISQKINFKLLRAIETQDVVNGSSYTHESLTLTYSLPAEKKFLIIIGEATYDGEKSLRLDQKIVTVNNGVKAYGRLDKNNLFVTKNPENLDEKGVNYFTAVFVVDNSLNTTDLSIAGQTFNIPEFEKADFSSLFCAPEMTVTEHKYVKEFSFPDKDYSIQQELTKSYSPKQGEMVSVSLDIKPCNDIKYFRHTAYPFDVRNIRLVDTNGAEYTCAGTITLNRGIEKMNDASSSTIRFPAKKTEISFKRTIVFNVPKQGKFKLMYLDELVAEF